MTFLKWYTFIIILLSLLINLYNYAHDDNVISFMMVLMTIIPMLVYIFLS